ncbi:MAG: cytochrome c [Terriglobales bacterium]
MTVKNLLSCRKAVLVLLVVCGSMTWLSAETNSKPSAGETVFKSHCIVCHGADGMGKTTLGTQLKASDLHGKDVQKLTDAQLKEVITNGKNNMPPFSDQLTGAEINDLLKYVRTFGKAAK